MARDDTSQDRFTAEALPHLDRLHRLARRLVGGTEDAADLVQETFLRAFRTFASFRAGTDSRAWLFTILYSVFVNRYHERQRRPTPQSLTALEETLGQELAAPTFEDPLARLTAAEHAAAVREALTDLPLEYRSAVVLVDLEELSYEQAAQLIGCPVGTVRSRLSRGRRLLAGALLDHARRQGLVGQET